MWIDPDEKRIHCKECNGYLWSVGRLDPVPELVPCPFIKDPTGKCTGERRKREEP